MTKDNQLDNIKELIEIMALLRSENGCQWDKDQTPDSLKKHILEETYELLEAIDNGDPNEICDELGDLLLQVVFQAQIFTEYGLFGMAEISRSISDKLKRRHPHIFADASHEGHEQRWEEIKQQERASKGQSNQLAKRIPQTLPALKRCTKVVKKQLKTDPLTSIHTMQAELKQLEDELSTPDQPTVATEKLLSQLLLNICSISASIGSEPEDLLRTKTNQLISEIDSRNDVY